MSIPSSLLHSPCLLEKGTITTALGGGTANIFSARRPNGRFARCHPRALLARRLRRCSWQFTGHSMLRPFGSKRGHHAVQRAFGERQASHLGFPPFALREKPTSFWAYIPSCRRLINKPRDTHPS